MCLTLKQVYNIEGHLRSLTVYSTMRNQLALTSENYFSEIAPVFTLERACGNSQLQQAPQFHRVV